MTEGTTIEETILHDIAKKFEEESFGERLTKNS